MIENIPPRESIKNPEVKLPNEVLIADSYYQLSQKWWKYEQEHKELSYKLYKNIYETLMKQPELKSIFDKSTLKKISTRLGELAQDLGNQKDIEAWGLKFNK